MIFQKNRDENKLNIFFYLLNFFLKINLTLSNLFALQTSRGERTFMHVSLLPHHITKTVFFANDLKYMIL